MLVDLVVDGAGGGGEPVADGFPFFAYHRTDGVPLLLVLAHAVLQFLHGIFLGEAFHIADQRLFQGGVLPQVVVA